MARIKIKDLSAGEKISKKEMKQLRGGTANLATGAALKMATLSYALKGEVLSPFQYDELDNAGSSKGNVE